MIKRNAEKNDQNIINQSPANNQDALLINPPNKLKYYMGGIILGIITAALIIFYYHSKINKLTGADKRMATSSGSPLTTPQEESAPELNKNQYSGMSSEESPNNPLSMNTNEDQGNESSKNRIEEACKAVVTIKTASGIGSGFFINEDGYLLTNKHVSHSNQNAQDLLFDTRESLRNQIKENEELLSNIENELAGKKNDIETEDTWISENTDGRYYSKKEIEEKVAEVKTHQTQRQNLIREYNSLMIQYNTEKAKSNLLQQKYKEINSQIDKLAYNTSLTVYLADGTKKTASVISSSASHDIALLKVDGVKTSFIRPADASKSKVGDTLYAIGTPQGYSQTVTSGILSNFRDGYIQTNAQISPGNSGGPLINTEGKAIGINTSKIIADDVEGIGFAIPINAVVQEYSQYFY